MKKLLFTLAAMLLALVSCQKDGNSFKASDIIGEWKATKIEATLNSGKVLTITDKEDLQYELGELYWFIVTKDTVSPVNYNGNIQYPYEISDNYIVFTGAETGATYKVESVSRNELVIRYYASWTSLVYYKRMN